VLSAYGTHHVSNSILYSAFWQAMRQPGSDEMSGISAMPSLQDGGIVSLDATRMVAAIHNRHISCREVMEAHLDRIALVNGRMNAIVSLRDREELLTEADAADADLQRGLWRGPMHGLPHAVKDLAPTRGLRTTSARRSSRSMFRRRMRYL
jgi:hypothetical protein